MSAILDFVYICFSRGSIMSTGKQMMDTEQQIILTVPIHQTLSVLQTSRDHQAFLFRRCASKNCNDEAKGHCRKILHTMYRKMEKGNRVSSKGGKKAWDLFFGII